MNQSRGKIFVGVLVAGFLVVMMCQAKVQIFNRNIILQKAKDSSRFLLKRISPPIRGLILTEDGKPLAENIDSSQMCLNYNYIPHNAAFYSDLSVASGVPESLIASIPQTDHYSCFHHPININQSKAIEKVKENWKSGGVSVSRMEDRRYPLGPYAAGFVGKLNGNIPIEGLEKGYAEVLQGKPGMEVGLVDREGHFLPQWSAQKSSEEDGKNITTTIDRYMQIESAQAIREAVTNNNAVFGVAIVMNPHNGNILAMANWPSYDPDPQPGDEKLKRSSDFDGAYEARLEPGSMFKILTLSEGLETGAVPSDFTLDCPGTIYVVGHATVRCDVHGGTRAHGLVDLEHAIGESCNISAATWAMKIGRTRYIDFLNQSGLLQKPSLKLPGVIAGAYDKTDPSKLLQLADFGFGQSIALPPILLAGTFAAIGNGGYKVSPRLVDKIGDHTQPYLPRTQLFSTAVANQVRGYMESVIQRPFGTGHALQIPGYFLAGKTGTAQIANGNGGYVSNFVGFVNGDHPKVEILVMVDHPRKGAYFGAEVAGPVFRKIALAAIRRYQIPPNASEPHLLQDNNGDKNVVASSATIFPPTSPVPRRSSKLKRLTNR